MNLNRIDKSWTLFLDRDGVINHKRDNDYVKTWDEFVFIEGAKDALAFFNKLFGRIVIVTNQQGIGKGLYSSADLNQVHTRMTKEITLAGGRIDKIYFCPDLAAENPVCRKPNTGMATQAKTDFPEINFSKSVIVGDSESDMEFGLRLGMITIFIDSHKTCEKAVLNCHSLLEFSRFLAK